MNSRTVILLVAVLAITCSIVAAGLAQNGSDFFHPDNLVVSRSVYDNNPQNIQVGMPLPPNSRSVRACRP